MKSFNLSGKLSGVPRVVHTKIFHTEMIILFVPHMRTINMSIFARSYILCNNVTKGTFLPL